MRSAAQRTGLRYDRDKNPEWKATHVRAVVYRAFSGPPEIEEVADPIPPDGGVVLKVMASGVCLSDWHGWQGHDPDIVLPHVPGHELAGIVQAVGAGVGKWRPGDRVTLPFVCGTLDAVITMFRSSGISAA